MSFGQNSTFGFGSNASGSGGSGTVTGANDGLSSDGVIVKLGQDIGQGGDPAELLSDREIPLNGNNVVLTGTGMVGIGTNAPTTKLTIEADGDVAITLNSVNGGGSFVITFEGDGTGNLNFTNTLGNEYIFDSVVRGTAFLTTGGVVGATGVFSTNVVSPIVRGTQLSGGNLTLSSTSNGTKGKILFGTSGYDEVNNRLGIGQATPTAAVHIKAGSAAAQTAPIKLTSGPLMTTAEVGAIEFLTDKFYATITTGSARKEIALLGGVSLINSQVAFADANGNLIGDGNFTYSQPSNTLSLATDGSTNSQLILLDNNSGEQLAIQVGAVGTSFIDFNAGTLPFRFNNDINIVKQAISAPQFTITNPALSAMFSILFHEDDGFVAFDNDNNDGFLFNGTIRVTNGALLISGNIYGLNPVFSPASSPYAAPVSSSGVLICNDEPIGGDLIANLPPATKGLTYSFSQESATDNVLVVANGIDEILIQAASSNTITSTAEGDVITLVCIKTGVWRATSMIGTWS